MTELINLADSAHERVVTQETGDGQEELGVRKSASDEVMATRRKETGITDGGCALAIFFDWMPFGTCLRFFLGS